MYSSHYINVLSKCVQDIFTFFWFHIVCSLCLSCCRHDKSFQYKTHCL